MKKQAIKNISEVLQQSAFAHIVERNNQLQTINFTLKPLLPKTYQQFYRIINANDDTLTIEVPNATVRQGLWLEQHQLLRLIQQTLPQIQTLRFVINPDFKPIY
ncbi:uncharacterized protein DUF721 [Nicoletella semolina]|uniref:Uncharacterized protein DUF721 n=1 Tax=Nicoletella semolina TaxID=271160 RepID=A0A4R2NCX0_9PAST|nr:DciA family protein [Nicoletella semolina]MDH2924208.1 hypothetical protein [Nicoletella semolina]TCP18895.1 uncharacterized protein DUF721 [Nicoletella semolina]